jgi:hypothetical protein
MSEIYTKSSPYYTTPANGSYLDVLTYRDIPAEADDVQYTITSRYEYRPDLLAYQLYKNVDLWWVFAVRNKDKIKDSIYDLYAGQTIYLPKITTLQRVLGL